MRKPTRPRRTRRRVCLDLAHRHPDMRCPWCDPDPLPDPLLDAAEHQHTTTRTEDAEGFGWAA